MTFDPFDTVVLINMYWAVMAYSEKLHDIIVINQCSCFSIIAYSNKSNNSSVNESILTKLMWYRLSMVLVIHSKNATNLTSRCWDMILDGRKVRQTDELTDGRTHGWCKNFIPQTLSADNKKNNSNKKQQQKQKQWWLFDNENIVFYHVCSEISSRCWNLN